MGEKQEKQVVYISVSQKERSPVPTLRLSEPPSVRACVRVRSSSSRALARAFSLIIVLVEMTMLRRPRPR